MMEKEEIYDIGNIGNYYGGLQIRKLTTEDSVQYFWGVENYNGTSWEEIGQELFSALLSYRS